MKRIAWIATVAVVFGAQLAMADDAATVARLKAENAMLRKSVAALRAENTALVKEVHDLTSKAKQPKPTAAPKEASQALNPAPASKAALKFPWLHESEREKLNAPCGKTMLEWKCMEGRVRAGRWPIGVGRMFLTTLQAKHITANGMEIQAVVTTKTGKALTGFDRGWKTNAAAARKFITGMVHSHFCQTTVTPGTITIHLEENGQKRGSWDPAPPKAPFGVGGVGG